MAAVAEKAANRTKLIFEKELLQMAREIEVLKQQLREHGDLARAPAPPKGKGKAPGKDVSQHVPS